MNRTAQGKFLKDNDSPPPTSQQLRMSVDGAHRLEDYDKSIEGYFSLNRRNSGNQ